MGLGIVLLFWGVVGLIGATIASLILPVVALEFSRRTGKDRQRLILATRLFPFACLVWAGGVFAFYAVVNEAIFHRDPALGDGWYCPLPNGYALEMIDVTDRGVVYNPKTQSGEGVVGDQEDAVFDVRLLQLAGQHILGGANSRSYYVPKEHAYRDSVASYFLLDTGTGKRTDFPTSEALRDAALKLNIRLRLDPIDVVYGRYRYTWFDALAALGMFGVPLFSAWLLFRSITRIRKPGSMLPQPS